jgi:hypothetical protein
MNYQNHLSKAQLNEQLLVGLKKHLSIAQTTTLPKSERLTSLSNVAEVLQYVVDNINEAIDVNEQAIFTRFFTLLLTKVVVARVQIHQTPMTFDDEIGFISTVLSLKA